MYQAKPLKILLVDDDQVDRMAVKRALGKKNNKNILIDEACGISEAIQRLTQASAPYDCLLLDYRLGGQNGLQLIQKIQSESLSQAPIVMLSGIDDETIMLNCLKEGAQDFLLKSEISSHSLMRAIRYAQERKQLSLQMRHLAQHDALTGLANRTLFIERVKRAIARANREDSFCAIIFIDVDNFKSINDTLGHEAGDKLLTILAQRIQSSLRGEDLVGRLGGDEFSVLIEGVPKQTTLVNIAQQLLETVQDPVIIYNKTIHTSISVGIASYPSNTSSTPQTSTHQTSSEIASKLIKCADLAMYKAKQSGRNNYCFYSEDLQQLANEYANLKIDLHSALANNEFELYYQPQILAVNHQIAGVEALIRWHHPSRGMISPDKFIPVAESSGLINAIGDWVIEHACSQLKRWLTQFPDSNSTLTMAINVSALQIRQPNLTEKICTVVEKCQIPYGQVELELTESALIDDIDQCVLKLQSLSGQGIQMAIDDFGTGFSSFRHLQQMPLKTLKIDKTFIDQICVTSKNQTIVKAIIAMAHALQMSVVAEGVETKEQAVLLKELGCDKLQGFYFSRPLTASAFEKLLANPRAIPQVGIYTPPSTNQLSAH